MSSSIDSITFDKEGFLADISAWNKDIAKSIAANESIDLSDQHWEVINLLRDFYKQYELSPAMRPLVKYLKQKLGDEKGNSAYLMKLFRAENNPSSPAKLASKIAGLPKPTNCF